MSLVHPDTGEVIADCTTDEARALTDRIKTGVEAIWELIKQAYEIRAWAALGYSSWDDYCTREFGTSRLRLPREERQEVVASLRESGLSTRAIAAATGTNQSTIVRDQQRDAFASPDGDDDIPDDDSDSQPRVTGTDGASYPPSSPRRQPSEAVTDFLDSDQDLQDARYLHEFMKALARSDDFMEFDPGRLGELADPELVRTLDDYETRVHNFIGRFHHVRPGLHVVQGGSR